MVNLEIKGEIPVKKNTQRIGKYGGIYKDPAVKNFEEMVGWEIRLKRLEPIEGKVRVVVAIKVKKDKRDLDGMVTTLLDSMQYGGLIPNDKNVVAIEAYKAVGDEDLATIKVFQAQ